MTVDWDMRLRFKDRCVLWRTKAQKWNRTDFELAADQAFSVFETGRWPVFPRPLLKATRQSIERQRRLAVAKARGTHTDGEWWALQRFCGYACVRCGIPTNPLQKDHIRALHMPGASDSIDNIQPLCGPCNAGKRDGTDYRPDGWQEAVR